MHFEWELDYTEAIRKRSEPSYVPAKRTILCKQNFVEVIAAMTVNLLVLNKHGVCHKK